MFDHRIFGPSANDPQVGEREFWMAASGRIRFAAWTSGVVRLISPLARTSQQAYWAICGIYAAIWCVTFLGESYVHRTVIIFTMVTAGLFLLLHTGRRLHDAGHSRWWVALVLFPVSITFDVASLQVGGFQFHLVSISDLIRTAPFIAAIILPSQPPAGGSPVR